MTRMQASDCRCSARRRVPLERVNVGCTLAADATSLRSSCRIDGVGGVGTLPGDVCGGAVGGWDGFVQQAQVDGKLGAMMCGVQHAPPEDPHAFASDIEKTDFLKPPRLVLQR